MESQQPRLEMSREIMKRGERQSLRFEAVERKRELILQKIRDCNEVNRAMYHSNLAIAQSLEASKQRLIGFEYAFLYYGSCDVRITAGEIITWCFRGTRGQQESLLIDNGRRCRQLEASSIIFMVNNVYQTDFLDIAKLALINLPATAYFSSIYELEITVMHAQAFINRHRAYCYEHFGLSSWVVEEYFNLKRYFGLETGDVYLQHADGIMGLGRGPLSIVDQIVGSGAIEDAFTHCYGGMDEGGSSIVLGAIPTPAGMIICKMRSRSHVSTMSVFKTRLFTIWLLACDSLFNEVFDSLFNEAFHIYYGKSGVLWTHIALHIRIVRNRIEVVSPACTPISCVQRYTSANCPCEHI